MKKQTFALFFGNRGFMPAELIKQARIDMIKAVTDANYDYIIMDENLTRYGAVETRDEGLLYHQASSFHTASAFCSQVQPFRYGFETAREDLHRSYYIFFRL